MGVKKPPAAKRPRGRPRKNAKSVKGGNDVQSDDISDAPQTRSSKCSKTILTRFKGGTVDDEGPEVTMEVDTATAQAERQEEQSISDKKARQRSPKPKKAIDEDGDFEVVGLDEEDDDDDNNEDEEEEEEEGGREEMVAVEKMVNNLLGSEGVSCRPP